MSKIFLNLHKLVKEVGTYQSLFIIFFIGVHIYIRRLYDANMADKQNQINRLAEENKEYREKFIKMVDQKLFKGEGG